MSIGSLMIWWHKRLSQVVVLCGLVRTMMAMCSLILSHKDTVSNVWATRMSLKYSCSSCFCFDTFLLFYINYCLTQNYCRKAKALTNYFAMFAWHGAETKYQKPAVKLFPMNCILKMLQKDSVDNLVQVLALENKSMLQQTTTSALPLYF